MYGGIIFQNKCLIKNIADLKRHLVVAVIMYGLNDGPCRSLILEVEKIGEFISRCHSSLMINAASYPVIKPFK